MWNLLSRQINPAISRHFTMKETDLFHRLTVLFKFRNWEIFKFMKLWGAFDSFYASMFHLPSWKQILCSDFSFIPEVRIKTERHKEQLPTFRRSNINTVRFRFGTKISNQAAESPCEVQANMAEGFVVSSLSWTSVCFYGDELRSSCLRRMISTNSARSAAACGWRAAENSRLRCEG